MSGDSGGNPMAAIAAGNNVPAQRPPWMKGVQPQTLPQAMPGQLEAIAAQLAQGFAGGPDRNRTAIAQRAYFKDLNNTYDPVQSMNWGQGNTTTTKKTTTPAPGPQKPMDPWTPIPMPDGSSKPAWMTALVQKTGMPRTPGGR